MSSRAAIALAVLAFLTTVLVRLPAGVAAAWLPDGVRCDAPAGTVWNGGCGTLRGGPLALQSVQWRLHPIALLRLRLAVDLTSADAAASGRVSVELAPGGRIEVRDLSASVPLPDRFGLAPRFVSGLLQASAAHARLAGTRLQALDGRLELQGLELNPAAAGLPAAGDGPSQPMDLGSFEARFAPQPPGSPLRGELRDLQGPLALSGELRLQAGGAYDVSGTLAARAGAPAALEQLLSLLGPADASGRRAFSLAGTL